MTREEFIANGGNPNDWMVSWIGVDFDSTLAKYAHGENGPNNLGEPVIPILNMVKKFIECGEVVRIFTARVCDDRYADEAREVITEWLLRNGLPKLEITCKKDYGMMALYDDRAWHVVPNEGIIFEHP